MTGRLTERQGEVLAFITMYLGEKGYPPTVREIREAFHLRSNRGVIDHLRALERKGYIRRDPRSSRAIELLVDGEKVTVMSPSDVKVRSYPVAGRIAAGSPSPPIEDVREVLRIDEGLFGETGDFLLEVDGDSMIRDHIMPGDLLVVKRAAACENGDIIVAMVNGETTVKRYYRSGGRLFLHPSNEAYEPIVLAGPEIQTCTIVGKVIGIVRRHASRGKPFSG
jgi:repressor LexA